MASPLTDEQAKAMLAQLSEHFGEPVRPISHYCEALRSWQRVLGERAHRLMGELYEGVHDDNRGADEAAKERTSQAWATYQADREAGDRHALTRKEGREMTMRDYAIQDLREYESRAASVDDVFLQIGKSNLLARLLYAGEKLRTQMCPEHKGKWSGIEWSDSRCPHGCQLTGWIQEPEDKGTPLPGVQAVRFVSTGKEGEITVIKDVTGEVLGRAKIIVPKPIEKSPLYCEHANEVPQTCPCPADCYCKDHTCKEKP